MKHVFALIVASMAAVSAASRPPDDGTLIHVLNRVALGPRAGDVDRFRALGVERYIEQQLHPERLPDAAMAGRLARLETLTMSSREIAAGYERPLLEVRRGETPNVG